LWLGWDLPSAIGTSLLYVTAVGLTGALGHLRVQNVDKAFVAWTAVPAIAGAQVGAVLSGLLPLWSLDCAFVALLLYAAREMHQPESAESSGRRSVVVDMSLGALVGVLSGVLGVGGGVLLVPAQIGWLATPIKRAIGNSLAVVVLTGLSGIAAHTARGHVAWIAGTWLVAGGVVGLQIGLWLFGRLPTRRLRDVFVGFLGLLAIYMGIKAFGALPWHLAKWGAALLVS
jgi:uncharacterized membrane protein YfcA